MERPVAVDELAAEGLAEAGGRLGDLLEQEVRVRASVDVAGGDLRVLQVCRGDGEHRAVVGLPGDAVEGAGARTVEHDDLTSAGVGVLRVGGRVAIEAHVARGELDEPDGLGRHHEAVVGEADVERLPAASQGEEKLVRVRRRGGRDGNRALEAGDGVAERGGEVGAVGQPVRHERGDHLRVGGDLGRQAEPAGRLQVGEVVDVAVEGGGDERPALALHLEAVHRVGVGLADDPDARPSGVAEDQRRRPLARQGEAEEVVDEEIGAHGGRVVAELADLRGGLVDEAEVSLRGAHRLRPEEVVAGASGDEALHRRVGEIEVVITHEHGEPGTVAAAHLEAIEGGEGLVDGRAHLDGRPRGIGAHQRPNTSGGGQPVAHHRPSGVLQAEQRGVGLLEGPLVRRAVGIQRRLGGADPVVDGGADGGRPRGDVAVADEQGDPVGGAEQCVELLEQRGRRVGGGDRIWGLQRLLDRAQRFDDLGWIQDGPGAGPSQEGDDAAHPGEPTGGLNPPRGPR